MRIPILLFFAVAASGQRFNVSSIRVNAPEVSGVWGPPSAFAIVTGAPYSADELQDYTPSDATTPSRSSIIGHYARDSQGRIRMSEAFKPAPVWLTEIFDPIAGAAYLLDDGNKVAHEMRLPPGPPPAASTPRNATIEKLGIATMDGIMVEGTRTRFSVLTIETWKSPELQIDLLTKSSNGYSSRLVNLRRGEPDAALFRPPAGYTVIHEDGPFQMTFRFQ